MTCFFNTMEYFYSITGADTVSVVPNTLEK